MLYENNVIQGFQIGKVINNYDKDHVGMVQVTLHSFMPQQGAMEWMRVLSLAAGAKKGAYFLPDIGDEVLVGFIDNDPNFPFVAGCLWNANTYPDNTVNEKNTIKKIRTKSGLEIEFNEEDKKESLTIKTPKGLTIKMGDENEKIEILARDDANSIVIDAKDKTVTVKSADKLTLEAKNITINGSDSIKLDSKSIKLNASNDVAIEGKSKLEASGAQVTIEGKTKLEASGAQTEIKGKATLKLEGSAMTEIKGGMVKING